MQLLPYLKITEKPTLTNSILAIFGFVAIFLTATVKTSILHIILPILGTVGLSSLSLFVLAGGAESLGIYGTISLVASLHFLLLPKLRNTFAIAKNMLKKYLKKS